MITDGPFAETREHLGGYFMINAKDLDEAIAVAARIPGAKKGTVEIRPVLDIPGCRPDKRATSLAKFRTAPSRPPEASSEPSSLKAIECTVVLWPRYVASSLPVSGFHTPDRTIGAACRDRVVFVKTPIDQISPFGRPTTALACRRMATRCESFRPSQRTPAGRRFD